MKIWGTTIYAKHNITGEMAKFGGPNIEAPSRNLAIQWCQENAGWLHVDDEVIAEIPCKIGEDGYLYEPDWSKEINYKKQQDN